MIETKVIVVDSSLDTFFDYSIPVMCSQHLSIPIDSVLTVSSDQAHRVFDPEHCTLEGSPLAVITSSFRGDYGGANLLAAQIKEKNPAAVICGLSTNGNHFDPELFDSFIKRTPDLHRDPQPILDFIEEAIL